eukprot:6202607-Pleurochrysis_carterae.AAC.2
MENHAGTFHWGIAEDCQGPGCAQFPHVLCDAARPTALSAQNLKEHLSAHISGNLHTADRETAACSQLSIFPTRIGEVEA